MLYKEMGETTRDCIFAGTEVTPITTGAVIASGQGKLGRGAVLGLVSKEGDASDGKYKLVDSTAVDGSQKALLVLSQDVDATAEDVTAVCYKTGVYNRESLTFGGSDNAAAHEAELRLLNIHMKDEF